MPLGPEVIKHSAAMSFLKMVCDRIDAQLLDANWVKESVVHPKTKPHWCFMMTGHASDYVKQELVSLYSQAGWSEVHVVNYGAETHGAMHESGICVVNLYQ